MPIELKIPHVGESVTEVQIAEWLKAEGDTVKKDENVAVIDSDKTTFELPSPVDGRLTKLLFQVGDRVPVGEIVAHFEANGAPEKSSAETAPPAVETPAKPAVPSKPEKKPVEEKKAEPLQKSNEPAKSSETEAKAGGEPEPKPEPKLDAKTKGEAKPKVEAKVEAPAQASTESKPEEPAPAPTVATGAKGTSDRGEKRVPISMLRRTIARRLVEAKQQTAMLTTFNEVDMSAVQTLRKEHQEAFKQRFQTKLGIMSFFIKAAVEALKQFPQLNAELREDDIIYRDYCDIGAAIASERGLVVPVLRNAERMNFSEMEKAVADFAQRAKDGKLKPQDLEGGTFTITNGGVFGSLFSTPILNPPQSGILGMHTIQERPVAVQGQVVIRPMMYIALTYDHRIVDGREAVQFLHRIKETIENPARLLIGV